MNARILLLVGALLLGLASCGGADPLEDSFPKTVGGMPLVELHVGAEALKRISMLHGRSVEAVNGVVAVYKVRGARPAVVFVTRAASRELSQKQTRAMLDAMSHSPTAHFSDPVTAEMDGLEVFRFKGLGQSHFIFQAGDQSWWLSADPDDAGVMLQFFLSEAKKR